MTGVPSMCYSSLLDGICRIGATQIVQLQRTGSNCADTFCDYNWSNFLHFPNENIWLALSAANGDLEGFGQGSRDEMIGPNGVPRFTMAMPRSITQVTRSKFRGLNQHLQGQTINGKVFGIKWYGLKVFLRIWPKFHSRNRHTI